MKPLSLFEEKPLTAEEKAKLPKYHPANLPPPPRPTANHQTNWKAIFLAIYGVVSIVIFFWARNWAIEKCHDPSYTTTICVFVAVVLLIVLLVALSALTGELKFNDPDLLYGPVNPHMICPHCGEKGTTRTKKVDHKTGISGGKATAAVLTGGWSLLATGLSRKEAITQAHCSNCDNTWVF